MYTMEELIRGIQGCGCGREHLCPIRTLEISGGALDRLPALLEGFAHILLVADSNTWRVCGARIAESLGGRAEALVFNTGDHVLVPDEAAIGAIGARVTKETDLLLGVGSGVINDLCKHVSFAHGLPYAIAATAPSMDGYASVGAALILGGMKETLSARPPMAIIADTDVLREAPMDMIQAGWGDIVGKYSCLNDWKLAALIRGEYFCQTVYDLVMDTARRVEGLAEGVLARDGEAIRALMEALVAVGVAMSYVGNSRPASGSEHHLSHFFEITGIVHGQPYYPHGVDVLYSAVVTAAIRRALLESAPQRQAFDRAAWEKEIVRIYGGASQGVQRLQERLGWMTRDDSGDVLTRWEEICAVLREAPDEAQMRAMVSAIGLDVYEFGAFYGEEKIAEAIRYAKDLKDRYTVLWLAAQYHTPIGWKA